MWLSKLDFDRIPLDQDADDRQARDTSRAASLVVVKERRPRSSITMAERLRRGMTREMAVER